MVDFKRLLEKKQKERDMSDPMNKPIPSTNLIIQSDEAASRDIDAITGLSDVPDYLKDVKSHAGLEGLGKDDFKIPRVKLIQGNNPEVEMYDAQKGDFWHTGLNISLGRKFLGVPVITNRRVVLWRPKSDGGGILAFSKDGKTWTTGANQEFLVKLKDIGTVRWLTKGNVEESGLTNFGSSYDKNPQSAPAATTVYEYLLYLLNWPNLSPCVYGLSRTAAPIGKNFNTSLYMTGKPTSSVAVQFTSGLTARGGNEYHIPNLKLAGFVPKNVYDVTMAMADRYKEYNVEYDQEEQDAESREAKDEIPF